MSESTHSKEDLGSLVAEAAAAAAAVHLEFSGETTDIAHYLSERRAQLAELLNKIERALAQIRAIEQDMRQRLQCINTLQQQLSSEPTIPNETAKQPLASPIIAHSNILRAHPSRVRTILRAMLDHDGKRDGGKRFGSMEFNETTLDALEYHCMVMHANFDRFNHLKLSQIRILIALLENFPNYLSTNELATRTKLAQSTLYTLTLSLPKDLPFSDMNIGRIGRRARLEYAPTEAYTISDSSLRDNVQLALTKHWRRAGYNHDVFNPLEISHPILIQCVKELIQQKMNGEKKVHTDPIDRICSQIQKKQSYYTYMGTLRSIFAEEWQEVDAWEFEWLHS